MRNTLLFFLVTIISNLFGTIINIPEDQPTLQAGINITADGDTVLVQPGTYFENINYNGKNITVASLFLTTQDTTYISETIIDGDSSGSVVTFNSGENLNATLIGFTIQNGYALQNSDFCGGGIFCSYSNPNIMNVTISGNIAGSGGGIFCTSSTLCLNNILITNNFSTKGGGIYCRSSNISLMNAIISGNSASDPSGGNNGRGGGIYCWNNSPIFMNVIISENLAENHGGGIYCNHSSPSIVNVSIIDNISYLAGGIYCFFSSPNLKNVLITGNSSFLAGGIYCYTSNPNLLNATITGNSAESAGGSLYCYNNSNPCLTNCILWNDLPQEIFCWDYLNTISISYSDIQGGEAGIVTNYSTVNWFEGNIDEDPLFVGTGGYSFSLLEDSPCIDVGIPDTTGLNLPPWDIIGNHRIWDGDENGSVIIDMGAYEYGAPPYVDIDDNEIIQTPEVFLQQNYPNPFNPTTTILFSIPTESKVELSIYNIKGQKIKTLAKNDFTKGSNSVVWNGEDENGQTVGSGVYLYKLNINGKTEVVKKCLLLK